VGLVQWYYLLCYVDQGTITETQQGEKKECSEENDNMVYVGNLIFTTQTFSELYRCILFRQNEVKSSSKTVKVTRLLRVNAENKRIAPMD
jgi:hypothetical protein